MAVDRRSRLLVLAGVTAVAVVAAVGLVWFFGGSEPDAVDLSRLEDGDDANAEMADGDAADADPEPEDAAVDSDDGDAASSPDGDGLDGTWVVDRDAETFDLASGAGSFVGYRVDEELSGIGAATAVGRTPAVEGEVTVVDGAVTAAEVEADLTQLSSDESRRDGRLRSTLSPDASARFVLTGPIGPVELEGDAGVSVMSGTGELTIEGVTRSVEVELQVVRRDGHVVVGGSLPIVLSDYGVQPPSAPIVLSVSDEAIVEWQLYLSPA